MARRRHLAGALITIVCGIAALARPGDMSCARAEALSRAVSAVRRPAGEIENGRMSSWLPERDSRMKRAIPGFQMNATFRRRIIDIGGARRRHRQNRRMVTALFAGLATLPSLRRERRHRQKADNRTNCIASANVAKIDFNKL